jgi:hypothetical protein
MSEHPKYLEIAANQPQCTPTARIWPAKCDRCLLKGFSCSVGRRVERKSKHTPAYPALETPVARQDEPSDDGEDGSKRMFDNWCVLRFFYPATMSIFHHKRSLKLRIASSNTMLVASSQTKIFDFNTHSLGVYRMFDGYSDYSTPALFTNRSN